MPAKPLITHRQVEAFRAVMLIGSVTRAADAIGTSQPTLSRVLAELGRAVGFPLFFRQGRRVLPTREGLAFFAEVDAYYQGLERMEQAASVIRRTGGERLRVAAVTSVCLGLLPTALRAFRQIFPDVGVIVKSGRSESVLTRVLARQCEVGLAIVPTSIADLQVVPVANAEAVCVLPAEHPLAAKSSLVPEEVASRSLIVVSNHLPGRRQIDQLFSARNIRREPVLEVQSGVVACAMVAHGLGIAVLDALTVHAIRDPRVVARPLRPTILFRYSVLAMRSEVNGRLVGALIEAVRQAAADARSESAEITIPPAVRRKATRARPASTN